MKFLVAIALIATVASGAVLKPTLIIEQLGQLQDIIDAINSPSVNPATAAMLEAHLLEVLGLSPIVPSPAIVEPIIHPVHVVDEAHNIVSPIAIGPEIIPFPVPEGALGEVPAPIVPGPVIVAPEPAVESSPLVQIIVNVNGAAAGGPSPVAILEPVAPQPAVDPVHVVDEAENIFPMPIVVPEPIVIGPTPILPNPIVPAPMPVLPLPVLPEPVIVVEPPTPVIVVEPPKPEPISIGEPTFPIIPEPIVLLPETLN